MALLSSEIARLIHHHLLKEGCVGAANSLISECPHLKGLKPVEDKQTGPYKLPRLIGPSLQDLLEEYFETKDCIIDELEAVKCENYKVQNCLVTLTKTLLQSIKLLSSVVAKRPTCHASVNTDIKTFSDVSINTETASRLSVCDVSVNTEKSAKPLHGEEDSQFDAEMSPDSQDFLDFSIMYDRLLEDSALHEKIAETINKTIGRDDFALSTSSKSPDQTNSISETSCDLSSVIKSIVAETHADPVIDDILKDCLGVGIEDITPVNTPNAAVLEEDHSSDPQCDLVIKDTLPIPNNEAGPSLASLPMNSLNGYAIVTAANGQVTLQPTVLTALPTLNLGMPLVNPIPVAPILPRRPVAIAPKPQISVQVDNAVNDALTGFSQEFTVQPLNSKSPAIKLQTVPPVNGSQADKSKPKRIMKVTHPLKKIANSMRSNKNKSNANLPSTSTSSNPTGAFTPALTSLLALVSADVKASSSVNEQNTTALQEVAKNVADQEHVAEDQNGGSSISQSSNSSKKDSPISDADKPPPISPASGKKRRSHIRVLDFGVSPGSKGNSKKSLGPAPESKMKETKEQKKKTGKTWDADLRFLTSCSSAPEVDVFATPKGKAKRAKKVEISPPPTVGGVECKELEVEDSPAADMLTPCEASTPAVQRPDSGLPSFVPSVNATSCSSLFREIVQTPMKDVDNSVREESLPRVDSTVETNVPLAQPKELDQMMEGINDLFTPQKVDDTTSSVFSWIGEIPRTPQINTELTSSSSPLLVSLTKGFQFLPAAESPTLTVPATPSIAGEYTAGSNSIDTPCANFYQFPQTPRLEALRQELLSSPCQSLSSTMISPTQVVLGRSTPYFVPSGERAKGPILNQNATPEHLLETQESEKRRNSTEMEPLQLEESNDASDYATMLLSKAAAESTSCLETIAEKAAPTPVKSDTSLENLLINECQRLGDPAQSDPIPSDPATPKSTPSDSAPSNLTPCEPASSNPAPSEPAPPEPAPSNPPPTPLDNCKLKDKFLDLFGDDSGFDAATHNKSTDDSFSALGQGESAVASTQLLTTPKSTRKPRRKRALDEEENTCARFQDYCKSPLFRQKSKRRSTSLNSSQEEETTQEGYENVIQELLLMATANIDDSESPKKPQKQRRTKRNATEAQSTMKEVNQLNNSLPEDERRRKDPPPTRHSLPKPATRVVRKSPRKSQKNRIAPLRGSPKLFKCRPPPYSRKAVSFRQTINNKNRSLAAVAPPNQQEANQEAVDDKQISQAVQQAANQAAVGDKQTSQAVQQVSSLAEQVNPVEEAVQQSKSSQDVTVSSPCKESIVKVVENIGSNLNNASASPDDQCDTTSRLHDPPELKDSVSLLIPNELVEPSPTTCSQTYENTSQMTLRLSESSDSVKPFDETAASLQSVHPSETKTQKNEEKEASVSTMQNYVRPKSLNDANTRNGSTATIDLDGSQPSKLRCQAILAKFLSRAQKRLRTEKIDVFSQ